MLLVFLDYKKTHEDNSIVVCLGSAILINLLVTSGSIMHNKVRLIMASMISGMAVLGGRLTVQRETHLFEALVLGAIWGAVRFAVTLKQVISKSYHLSLDAVIQSLMV